MEKRGLFRKNKKLIGCYTALFIVISLIAFSYFYLNDKTFIHGDGWYQHYTSLLYYSKYLKEAFHSIFVDHVFSLPTWDFSIGEGEDIITAMHYYCIGDPVAFLSVFVPERWIYLFYSLSSLLRIYLAGLSFIYLCLYTNNNDRYAVIGGSLAYTFCYWNLLNTSKHIFFLNPMIYFPLFIVGVEKVLNRDNGFFLSFAVCFGALSNFYFFYMMVILTVIYTAVRLLIKNKTDIKQIVKEVLSVFVYSLIGALLAAVILFPIINTMLSSGRLNVEYGFHLLYPKFYYERLITMFLTCDNEQWLVMGYVSPAVLSTALAFRQPKKDPLLFALHLIALFGISVPLFGKVLNGFAYVANRWSFSLALLTSYTLTKKWNEFDKDRKFLVIFTGVFLVFSFVTAWWRIQKVIPSIIYCVFLAVTAIDLKVYDKKPHLRQICMIALIILSILSTSDYAFSERGKNRINGAKSVEEAKGLIRSNEASVYAEYIENTKDEGLFRYSGSQLTTNAAMLSGVYSTNYYFSLSNADVGDYRSSLGVNEYFLNWYNEYDKRTPLYSLANVRYYVVPSGENEGVPYGFDFVESLKGQDIYRNTFELPFGYTYDSVLSYEDWRKLSQAEREEAMLYNIVLDEASSQNASVLYGKNIDCLLSDESNKTIDISQIVTEEKDDSFLLKFNGEIGKVYYLCIEGIDYDDGEDYYFGDPITDVSLKVRFSGKSNEILYHTDDYQFYNGRNSFISCLGYQEEKLDRIELVLSKAGVYSFDRIYIRSVDPNVYKQRIDNLSKDHLDNISVEKDKLSATIDLSEDKYVLLSVPYSKGWKAVVDGQNAEILRANDCYSALKLEKGRHEIRLTYHTPYLLPGAAVSLTTACCLFAYLFFFKRKATSRNDRIVS